MSRTPIPSPADAERLTGQIALAVVLLGIASRFFSLGGASLHLDEVFSFATAQDCRPRDFSYNDLLTCLFFRALGESELVLRLPSALFGAAAFPVTWWVARRLWDRQTALVAVALLLFNPYHLFHSQFGRYYAKVFLCSLIALYFFHRYFRTARPVALAAALVASAAGLFFHPTALLVPLSAVVFSALVVVSRRFDPPERRAARVVLVVAAVGAMVAIPFAFRVIRAWTVGQAVKWGPDPFSFLLQLVKYFGLPLVVATAAAILLELRRRPRQVAFWASFLLTPPVVMLALSLRGNVRPDYVIGSLPVVILWSAVLVTAIARQAQRPLATGAIVTTLLVVPLLPELVSHFTSKSSFDMRTAVDHLERVAAPEDRVVSFSPAFSFYLGDRYDVRTRDPNRPHRPTSLDQLIGPGQRTWIAVVEPRSDLHPQLEEWLFRNARLVYEQEEERFDYTFRTIRIYRLDAAP